MGKGVHDVVPMETTIEALAAKLPGADPPQELQPVPAPKRSPLFAKGNQFARLKAIKNRARGITSLSPESVPTFMKADVAAGIAYAGQMLRLLEDRPVLLPMAGMVADSYTVAKAFLKEALRAWKEPEGTYTLKEKLQLLAEAKSWMKMHEQQLATLTRLSGGDTLPPGGVGRVNEKLKKAAAEKGDVDAIDTEGVEEPEEEVTGAEALRRQIRAGEPDEEVEVPSPPPTDPSLGSS